MATLFGAGSSSELNVFFVFFFFRQVQNAENFVTSDRCLLWPKQVEMQNDKEPIDSLCGLGTSLSILWS